MRGVTFRYGRQSKAALQDIDLDVRAGCLFGLLGPNGSGKTTMFSLLAGLLRPSAGAITVGGLAMPGQLAQVQAFSSLSPQENAFYPTLSVAENLAFFAGVQLPDAAARAARIDEVLAVAGLGDEVNKRACFLSGGMRRRLSIAISLLNRPRLLLLDEPTVGIDPQSRQFLLEAVRRINAAGTTVVYSSHYMEEVASLCDEVAILHEGRLIVQGTLSALLAPARDQRLCLDVDAAFSEAQTRALAVVAGLRLGRTRLELETCTPGDLDRILEVLRAERATVTAVQYGTAALEDVFLALTRRRQGA